jgi:hypothetical protein
VKPKVTIKPLICLRAFGLGNPKIASEFACEASKYRGFPLLVIHRSGCMTCGHAQSQVRHYQLTQIALRRVQAKTKKVTTAIYAEETGGRRTNCEFPLLDLLLDP